MGCLAEEASKIETDLDFDTVQRIGLDAGLVDNKSAVDDLWQALRFVYRLEDRWSYAARARFQRGSSVRMWSG